MEKIEGQGYILRRPSNKEVSPGPNNWTCVLVINGKNASIKILNGLPGPTIPEVKQLKKHIQAMGCDIGEWERHKTGKPAKKVVVV